MKLKPKLMHFLSSQSKISWLVQSYSVYKYTSIGDIASN